MLMANHLIVQTLRYLVVDPTLAKVNPPPVDLVRSGTRLQQPTPMTMTRRQNDAESRSILAVIAQDFQNVQFQHKVRGQAVNALTPVANAFRVLVLANAATRKQRNCLRQPAHSAPSSTPSGRQVRRQKVKKCPPLKLNRPCHRRHHRRRPWRRSRRHRNRRLKSRTKIGTRLAPWQLPRHQ